MGVVTYRMKSTQNTVHLNSCDLCKTINYFIDISPFFNSFISFSNVFIAILKTTWWAEKLHCAVHTISEWDRMFKETKNIDRTCLDMDLWPDTTPCNLIPHLFIFTLCLWANTAKKRKEKTLTARPLSCNWLIFNERSMEYNSVCQSHGQKGTVPDNLTYYVMHSHVIGYRAGHSDHQKFNQTNNESSITIFHYRMYMYLSINVFSPSSDVNCIILSTYLCCLPP